MANQSGSDRETSSSADSHGLLRGLFDALHHLIMAISSRLRHIQIHRSPMGEAKGDYDLWEKLGSHVEQIPVEPEHDKKPRAIDNGAATHTHRHGASPSPSPASAAATDHDGLSEHNAQKAALQHLPRMQEQLQRTTMEHINIALILAKQGDKAGAKLRIDLANSAMHTASRFMSHEDYEAFERSVEHRVVSIIEGDSKDASAT